MFLSESAVTDPGPNLSNIRNKDFFYRHLKLIYIKKKKYPLNLLHYHSTSWAVSVATRRHTYGPTLRVCSC